MNLLSNHQFSERQGSDVEANPIRALLGERLRVLNQATRALENLVPVQPDNDIATKAAAAQIENRAIAERAIQQAVNQPQNMLTEQGPDVSVDAAVWSTKIDTVKTSQDISDQNPLLHLSETAKNLAESDSSLREAFKNHANGSEDF